MKCVKTLLKTIDDKDIIAYNVKFKNGFEFEILNLGGIITKIKTPDKYGNIENIVVGYKNIEDYIINPFYYGGIIGRTSGRICDGKVIIEGKEYQLNKNYTMHQGHGGNRGFSHKIWHVDVKEDNDNVTLKFISKSLDGEENYPGNLDVCVSFKIYEDYRIEEIYEAMSDKTTLVNMTNHSYFNLSGDIKRTITQCNLKVDSDEILELDYTCVPTGKKINVGNTPFDFRTLKNIGKDIDKDHEQIKIGNGYDHVFLLNDGKSIYIEEPRSQRTMTINTNQNSVVIYTMNYDDELVSYTGEKAKRRYGICFETQAPPIGRNMCFIEDSIINKGEMYMQKTTYTFDIKK